MCMWDASANEYRGGRLRSGVNPREVLPRARGYHTIYYARYISNEDSRVHTARRYSHWHVRETGI